MLLWFCSYEFMRFERVVASAKLVPTWGFNFEPTTITLSRASSTRAAAWRRSRLFAMASETTPSRPGSLKDFTQSPVTFSLFGAAPHAGVAALLWVAPDQPSQEETAACEVHSRTC